MKAEINIDDEVLSEAESTSTIRPSTADSVDMPKTNRRSGRDSFRLSQSSNIDFLDTTPSPIKSAKEQEPIKVLVVHGKCSKVFKSTLEECVEDCILEFPGEKHSVYVSKSGQPISIPPGSNRDSIASLREQSAAAHQSARSTRRRSSITQNNTLPQLAGSRNNSVNNFSLATTALTATAATRMRHQLAQQRFSLVDDISEESSERHSVVEEIPANTNNESNEQSKRPSLRVDESISPNANVALLSLRSFPSAKSSSSYRDRQKSYRLSDLVMFGPEYFAHVFNLPRHRSSSLQRSGGKNPEESTELERIKQDLFHRYLWTQKPQVSCRIRPMASYFRTSTFVI